MPRKIKVLFIYHSTGANLLKEGRVRDVLFTKSPMIELWDHSYNLLFPRLYKITAKLMPYHTGLSDQNGIPTGTDYHIQISNTDPSGFARLFNQKLSNPPINAFSKIVTNFDYIVFKSCFPVTHIESDEKLKHYQSCYLQIREKIDILPSKLFILFTPPPLRMEMTKKEYAFRARLFSNWMCSNEYRGGRKNMEVFDFFNLLAEGDEKKRNYNMLKKEYCRMFFADSHPNKRANEETGLIFADFLGKCYK